jgi:hypothetical protein
MTIWGKKNLRRKIQGRRPIMGKELSGEEYLTKLYYSCYRIDHNELLQYFYFTSSIPKTGEKLKKSLKKHTYKQFKKKLQNSK